MGCGIAIIKYLVFIFNLVFGIIGLALLVIGVIYKLNITTLTDTKDDSLWLAPTALIVVGSLIFIISFFGCCGAIRESKCMLITYAVLLVIIVILQITIGVFSFVIVRDAVDIKNDCRTEIEEDFNKYNATVEDKEQFDGIQQMLHCCGIDGPADWNGKVPPSCCINNNEACHPGHVSLYKDGCTEKSYEAIVLIVKSVGYVVFGICAAELLGVVFAFCLTNSMRNQYRRGVYA